MIDASIYQNIKPMQGPDVAESMGKMMTLRGLQQQEQINQMKMSEAQQASKIEAAKRIQQIALPVMETLVKLPEQERASAFPSFMKDLEAQGMPMNNVPKDPVSGQYIYDPKFVSSTYNTLLNSDYGMARQEKALGMEETRAKIAKLNAEAKGGGTMDPYKALMYENLRKTIEEKNKGKQLASEQVNRLSEYDSSLNMLDDLKGLIETNKDNFGPVKGYVGKLNKYDTTAQSLNSAIAKANQVVGKALEGGKLAEGDAIRYEKMLPNLSDSPEVALEKLNQVIKLVADKKNSELKTFRESGLNVSDFMNEQRDVKSILNREKKQSIFDANSANASDMKPIRHGYEKDGYIFMGGKANDPKNWKKK